MQENRFIEVGMPKLINRKSDICSSFARKKVKTIGVLCSGGEFINVDTQMINVVISAAKKYGFVVCVKLHPNYSQTLYPDVRWEDVDNVYEKEINAEEFKDLIDVAVAFRSTVFIEYIMQLFPTLLYKTSNEDCFKNVEWCKFSSVEQLVALIELVENNPDEILSKLKETRSFFSDIENVSDNYVKAYRFLLNGGLLKI